MWTASSYLPETVSVSALCRWHLLCRRWQWGLWGNLCRRSSQGGGSWRLGRRCSTSPQDDAQHAAKITPALGLLAACRTLHHPSLAQTESPSPSPSSVRDGQMFLVAARSAQWLACCFCPFPAVSCRISRSTAAICAYPCVTVLLLHLRRNLCGSVHSQPLSSQSLPWISRVNFIGARLWPWGTTWTVDTWTVPFAESMRALVAYSHTLAGWSDCDGLFVCRKRSSCHQIMSKQRWNPEKTEVPRVAVAIYFFRLASPFVSAWQRPLLQVSFRAAHPRRQQDASSARGALASICMHVRTKRRGSKHKRFCLRILLWQLLFLVLCCVSPSSIKLPRWNSLCQVVAEWRAGKNLTRVTVPADLVVTGALSIAMLCAKLPSSCPVETVFVRL